jgi:hypothetical protein
MVMRGMNNQASINAKYIDITTRYREIAIGRYANFVVIPIKYPTAARCLFQGMKKYFINKVMDN